MFDVFNSISCSLHWFDETELKTTQIDKMFNGNTIIKIR